MNPTGNAIQDVSFGDLLVATGHRPFLWSENSPLEVRRSLVVFVFFSGFFFVLWCNVGPQQLNAIGYESQSMVSLKLRFCWYVSVTFFVCTIWDLWNSVINMDKLRTGACFLNGPAKGELKEFSSSHWPILQLSEPGKDGPFNMPTLAGFYDLEIFWTLVWCCIYRFIEHMYWGCIQAGVILHTTIDRDSPGPANMSCHPAGWNIAGRVIQS